jgi:hypothetical protein
MEGLMNTAKQEVELMLSKIPDDSTLEDIQYNLYVLEKINRGIKRAEQDETVSHENVKKQFAKWLNA